MAELPPVTQEFRADTSHWRKAAEIISLHMGNLARDLAALDAADTECDHTGGGSNGMCGRCGKVIFPGG
jgi:hypothetical protein